MLVNILVFFSFLFFSLGQLGRISFYSQQVNFYVYEIFLILTLLILILKHKLKPLVENFDKNKIFYLFFASLFISFLINIWSFDLRQNFISFLYFARLIAYFAYFAYVSFALKSQKNLKKNLKTGFSLFVFLTFFSSLIQYFFYPNLRNLGYLGWDPHLYRMFGVFFDTSVSAAVFGLILFYLFFTKDRSFKLRQISYFLIAAYFLFIILSFARSSYLALIVTVGIYLLVKIKLKSLLIFISIFFLVLFLSPKPFGEGINLMRQMSLQSRLGDYVTATKIWLKKPLFGYGYNRIRYLKERSGLVEKTGLDISHSGASFHSSYLVILLSGGVIGLCLFLGILGRLGKLGGFGMYIIFLAIVSLSDNILLHPFIIFLGGMVLLLSFSPSRKLR